jgi:16S rRNA (uracil1498-N3)-methyltransferase
MSERFYLPAPPVDGRAVLVGDEARHLARVMRARPGDRVELFDGRGTRWPAEVAAISRDRVELRTAAPVSAPLPGGPALTVAVALPKGERQQWLAEKLTELGAASLLPLVTTRGVAEPGAAARARLERAVLEACKQCRRDHLLTVLDPATVAGALGAMPSGSQLLLADPGGAALVADRTAPGALVLVGPEGGFTPEEIAVALAAGARRVSFSRHVLRVETAALAAAARFA